MANLYETYLMNYAPYSVENTVVPQGQYIVSSEFLFCHVLDAVRQHKALSVVRMGDGEAGFMRFFLSDGSDRAGFINPIWCSHFGIHDCSSKNLKNIGQGLIHCAENCDFLGSSIWGASHSAENWSIEPYIKRSIEKPRCSNWFNMEWVADGCAHALVMNCSFAILHRDAKVIEKRVRAHLGKDPRFHTSMKPSGTFSLDGNLADAERFIRDSKFDVYLTSGGPRGKIWIHEMSRKYNKVILDIGQALIRCWGPKRRWWQI